MLTKKIMPFKIKRLTRERLNKGTCVVNLWHQISKYYVGFSSQNYLQLQETMQLHFTNLMLSRVHKTSATFIQHN